MIVFTKDKHQNPERNMLEDQVSSSQEAEREELDAVVEALARSPRLSRLLRYLGEKYFRGEIDQLHEYNIATDVFGRSKTAFDPGEDAIARVEAHRLRKKLKEFYETEGKNHPVRLSIPSGTYVPVFSRRADEAQTSGTSEPAEALDENSALPAPVQTGPGTGRVAGESGVFPPQPRSRRWFYVLLAAVLVICAVSIYWVSHSGAVAKSSGGAIRATALSAPAPSPQPASGAASVPIRILAGYTGKPQIDSAGAVWGTDRFFHEGGTWTRPPNFIARTSDPLLFEQWRTGDFFYDIPLQPGVYELHLYFVTSDRAGDTTSTFSVGINGEKVLAGFDVNSDALGENIADERVFRDVSPARDGLLHLSFTSERGAPALNALEILPGIPHKQLPIRIVTQPTSFTDHDGNVWHPDTYYLSGRESTQRQQVAGSPDPELFGTERYGHFTYAIPVDTRGRYTLVLHFAEFYFGPHASGVGGAGSRLFRVMCNGVAVLDDFDIYKEAGSLHTLTKTFYHVKPTAQGKINLTFEPVLNNATVSGIEVLDESQ